MALRLSRSLLRLAAIGIFVAVAPALCTHSIAGAESHNALELWYEAPAKEWTEALPIGNGRMAAVVFGGVERERIQFNEETVWTGGPRSYARAGANEYVQRIRQLLFDGKQREAEELAMEHFMSDPLRQMAYQPLGDLELRFDGHRHNNFKNYRRSLDLDSATAITTYELDGVKYTRQVFASYPARAIVIQLSCDKPRQLSFEARVSSPHREGGAERVDDRTLLLTGRVNDWKDQTGRTFPGQVRFASHVRVASADGGVALDGHAIKVGNATSATIILTAATNFANYKDLTADAVARSKQDCDAAAAKDFAELEREHLQDHQHLFRRVSLTLGPSRDEDAPTDKRIERYATDADPALAALFFEYGRYLMIACSRPGSQPANLQGKWNDQLKPSWESKYTVNINTEMNYWIIEVGNLAECGEPLFDALAELAESGRETAREHYGADGWVLHHNFDLWRGTAPINKSNHGIWPTGGAWLCQHLWWHYLYGGDERFLRERAYPLMKGASEFFVDTLVEDPRSDERWLISGPSNSPEQGGLVMGPTMDHQIIRELFANTIEAAEILGMDEEFREKFAAMRSRIAPNQIGRYGQLQEWLEDVDNPKNDHRHVSHLWGLHPGQEIGVDTPELFAAARRSLEFRGDAGTGWSRAWKVNFWARLRDGDRAHKVLGGLLTLVGSSKQQMKGGGVYPNLFDAHPPFQIDGNFGGAAGIAEMLLQSQRRTESREPIIELLPALPSAWPEGEVRGLRARGGVEVDITWSNGRLLRCALRSKLGRPFVVEYAGRRRRFDLSEGSSVDLDGELQAIDR
jgi:alpha-L-fucosidase 2